LVNRRILVLILQLTAVLAAAAQETNGFPDLNEVFQGRAFTNTFERDVFFLRAIRDRYPAQWPSLLAVNMTPGDYVVSPEKMQRFVAEVGAAAEGTDDALVLSNLAAVISLPDYYTNVARPELEQAVVNALIKLGPKGRLALAGAFSETHYRLDPGSLEIAADAVGKSGVSDTNVANALAATAFIFTTANGGSYPRCTERAVEGLLGLTNGIAVARAHLTTNAMFADPGRFQSVVDGVGAAHATALLTKLEQLLSAAEVKLSTISPGPDPYRDDLAELEPRIKKTVELLDSSGK